MIPRVRSGQVVSAHRQNQIADALNGRLADGGESPAANQAGQRVFVLNKTGMALELGMVAPFKPSAANPYPDAPERQFSGTVGTLYDPGDWSTEDTQGDDPPWSNWVVMAQRIPNNQSGWAYASGVVMARLRNEEAGSASLEYQYADLSTWEEGGGGSGGTAWYHLNRMPAGSARILWADPAYDGTGSAAGDTFQLALIRFNGVSTQPVAFSIATATDAITGGKRVKANGDLATVEEYFAPAPAGRLAIPVRTADGKQFLWTGAPAFAEATSNPSDGTLTIKLAESDGTLVGDDITVYDGGIV